MLKKRDILRDPERAYNIKINLKVAGREVMSWMQRLQDKREYS
jgi:hypothetical protein